MNPRGVTLLGIELSTVYVDRSPGRPRQRSGSLIAAYAVGYLETVTAYLVSHDHGALVRPRGLMGRR
jgi:hypothetical protein